MGNENQIKLLNFIHQVSGIIECYGIFCMNIYLKTYPVYPTLGLVHSDLSLYKSSVCSKLFYRF